MMSSVTVTTPSEREIAVTREFNAPAQTIFDFHTKPELVKKWLLGPPGWIMPVCEIDLRPGGHYSYRWSKEDGSQEFGVAGEYREIAAPHRIVNVERMDGVPGECVCTATFVESHGRTVLTMTLLFENQAYRDGALQSGMTDGMSMSYDRLEPLVHG